MKQIPHLMLALLAAAVLSACDNAKTEIEQAARGYLDALGNYRIADARPYATEQTCDVTLTFFDTLMAHTDPQAYADNIPAEITINGVTMTSDSTATVAFHKSTPSIQQDGSVEVVKVDGRWLVDQVIDIPPMFRTMLAGDSAAGPRTFTDDELRQMRENRAAAQ